MESDVTQKEMELLGGLKNAVSRGENLEMAKRTFINAGYSAQIVNMAAQRILGQKTNTVSEQPVPKRNASIPTSNVVLPSGNLNLRATQSQPQPKLKVTNYPVRPVHRRKFLSIIPYWAVVLMLLLSLAIVIGAAVIGLFWNELFLP